MSSLRSLSRSFKLSTSTSTSTSTSPSISISQRSSTSTSASNRSYHIERRPVVAHESPQPSRGRLLSIYNTAVRRTATHSNKSLHFSNNSSISIPISSPITSSFTTKSPSTSKDGPTPTTGKVQLSYDRDRARQAAESWIAAWNSRNLDEILSHYHENIRLFSPIVQYSFNKPSGVIQGKKELQAYFRRGLEVNPRLHFDLKAVLYSPHAVVILYDRENGSMVAEHTVYDQEYRVVEAQCFYTKLPE